MPRTIYVDSGRLGHDSNTGLHPKRPKKSLTSLAGVSLTEGDLVKLRYGSLFHEALTVSGNGVHYGAYHTGSEAAAPPQIDTAGTGIRITGQNNIVEDIDVWHAETGVLIDKGANGNSLSRLRVQDFGYGVIIKAAHTTVIDPYIGLGRMVRNTGVNTDVGAQAFVLWKEPNVAHTGTRISGGLVEQAWADALAFEDGDGAVVEVFGGVSDVRIEGLTSLDCAVLVEVGGTTSRKETASGIVFARCLTMGSGGKVAFFNPPDSDFYVNWEGFDFSRCTFIADEYDESPFYVAGNQGDLSKKLRLDNCIIVGTSQIYNGGEGTKLETIRRSGNIYWRTDGTNVGVKLMPDERFEDPRFFNPAARDYRLIPRHSRAGQVGALDGAQTLESSLTLTGTMRSPTNPYLANELAGGFHAVPRWTDMTAIPMKYRVPGMRCRVGKHRLTYELQDDKLTWLKVS